MGLAVEEMQVSGAAAVRGPPCALKQHFDTPPPQPHSLPVCRRLDETPTEHTTLTPRMSTTSVQAFTSTLLRRFSE